MKTIVCKKCGKITVLSDKDRIGSMYPNAINCPRCNSLISLIGNNEVL